jgi:hypothetical protein
MTSIRLNRRTPIQPILGLSETIRPKVNTEDREYMDVIVRNAKRLETYRRNPRCYKIEES